MLREMLSSPDIKHILVPLARMQTSLPHTSVTHEKPGSGILKGKIITATATTNMTIRC